MMLNTKLITFTYLINKLKNKEYRLKLLDSVKHNIWINYVKITTKKLVGVLIIVIGVLD